MNYIYCYTNKINGHKYVGQTNNIERRKREHLSDANNPNSKEYNYLFHKKLREYGEDNFIFSILQEIDTEDKAIVDEAEKFWIKQMKSFVRSEEGGYNLTEGGNCNSNGIYIDDIENIKAAIKKGTNFSKIQEQFGISISHLSAINHGKYYFDEKETYPLYRYYNNNEEVQYIKDLLKNSSLKMTEIADKTGMAYSTIKKINSGALQFDENEDYPLRKINAISQKADIIKQMLMNGNTNAEIIAATGVSAPTIGRINKGQTHYDSKLTYPLR